MRNFHLPLPEQTWGRLRSEAERAKVPATTLAREAIDTWLRGQQRKAIHEAISDYAAEVAGTTGDLDPLLEKAGVEHLLREDRPRKKARARK